MRERLRNRAHNGWGPGGGAPGSSGVLYILVQFDGHIFFFIHVYISVGDWMNTLFPLLSPPSPLFFFFFFSMPKSGGARAPPAPPLPPALYVCVCVCVRACASVVLQMLPCRVQRTIQWNLVITRTLGPRKLPCYNQVSHYIRVQNKEI